MLQLVLGGSGSGKTTLLYQKIKERALAGQKSILLVPEQFTASTESRIYRELGDAHSGMVESFSFSSLAERVLATCGGSAVKTLSDAGRAVLVRRAMHELQDHLVYYRKQRQNAAFCQMVAQTIDELKSAGVSASELSSLASQCGTGRDKISDLALIYAAYQAGVQGTELDPTDRVNLAAQQLIEACNGGELPEFLAGRAVFIDEFDTFNAPKKKLMGALFCAVESITASLCADGLSSSQQTEHKPTFFEDVSLFSGARRVAFDLRTLARKAGVGVAAPVLLGEDVRHTSAPTLVAVEALLSGRELVAQEEANRAQLDRTNTIDEQDTAVQSHIMESQSEINPTTAPLEAADEMNHAITLFAAQSREEEARATVAEMQRLVRGGARYGKMAIVCRSLDQYRTVVQRECRLAGVPLFCDETTTPTFSAPVTAVRALLSILRGIDYTDQMIALAKTGLCGIKQKDEDGKTVFAPIPEYQILALENYVYTWSPSRSAWQQPFDRNPDGFGNQPMPENTDEKEPPAETARKAMLAPVAKLCDAVRGKTVSATLLTKQIYLCLQGFGAESQQAQQVAAVRKVQGIPAAEAAAREWNVIMELLDQMVHLLAEEQVSVTDYAELFLLLLNSSDLGHIPQNVDAVIFTSAGKMRLDAPEHVFVLGLAEGEFPAPPGGHGLLNDADRDALMAQNIELPDCFENKMVREDICFYKALTAPSKTLWLSWPEGLALPISSALAPVLAQLPYRKAKLDFWQNATTPAAAIDRLGSLWGEDSVEAASLYAALQQQAADTAAPWQAALTRFDALATNAPKQLAQPAQVAELLGDDIYISPSRVEQYYTCQYKYFLQYLLRLRPRQKAELSPNHSGSLMHWVLEQALTTEPTPYDDWKKPSFETLDAAGVKALAERLVEAYQVLYMPDDSVRFGYLMLRLKKSMTALLSYLQAERKQSGFVTAACEATIGTEEFPSPVYALDAGKTVSIVGVIDRIDTWQAEDGTVWMRVVDYKTGQKTFNLKEVYDGLDCQMLLYLFAALKHWHGAQGEPLESVEEALQRSECAGEVLATQGDAQTGAQTDTLGTEQSAASPSKRKAAGVQYLLADPAPQMQERDAAATQLRPGIEGLLSAHDEVLKASDEAMTGEYLPFAMKNGKADARAQKAKLADENKMQRIEAHLDTLVVEMAHGLYEGNIKAEPLCPSASKKPCIWCEFRSICRHEDGKGERGLTAPADPFAAPEVPEEVEGAETEAVVQAETAPQETPSANQSQEGN